VARALLVTQFLPPETFAGANRAGALAAGIASAHELTVVALRPGYPAPSLYSREEQEAHDRAAPYRVRRTFVFTPHRTSLFVRALRELAMALRLVLAASRERADLVVTTSPSMFLGPASRLLARLKRAHFCWDVRDVTWSYGSEVSRTFFSRLAAAALGRWMWSTARGADTIVTTSDGMCRRFVDAGVDRAKVLVVPNTIDQELVAFAASVDGSEDGRPRVTYAGLVGTMQGLDVLIDVARARPEVEFVIAGDGPERTRLRDRAGALELQNVRFIPYLARDALARLYASSQILFAQVLDTPTLRDTALPSKVYEYMAFSKPLLYAGTGIAKELVDRVGCGESVRPGDAEAIADAIDRLLARPELRSEMAARGRRFVEEAEPREETMRRLARELARRVERTSRP
jgi:glycosyltransferase involved in cell wall biosynthesis